MDEALFTGTRKNLVLICGYARAGKDTLATGIMEWSENHSYKLNFADSLKDVSNMFLESLQLNGNFHDEEFKTQNRDFLIAAGTFARRLNPVVFASEMANLAATATDDDYVPYDTIVCSDWRYLNELTTCQKILIPLGWRIRTVYIATRGISPACKEEANSIEEILDIVKPDQEYHFDKDARNQIMQEGRHLAKQWRL